MVGTGVACPQIKYLGLEVAYITSAVNSLVKSSQTVTFEYNEIKKAKLSCVQKGENK